MANAGGKERPTCHEEANQMLPSLCAAGLSQRRDPCRRREGGGMFLWRRFLQRRQEPLPYLLLDLAVLGDHPVRGGRAGPRR